MSHMKEISIRELHRRTGAWVRDARKYGSILIRDRNTPVAKLVPISGEPPVNVFKGWKPNLERDALANLIPLRRNTGRDAP